MTVEEFMQEQAQGWYNYYKNFQSFKDALPNIKVKALIRYLKPSQCHGFKATTVKVKAMLKAIQDKDTVNLEGENHQVNIEIDMGEEEVEQLEEAVDESGELKCNTDIIVEETEETSAAEQYRTKCKYLQKTDQELFGDTNIPEDVKKSNEYKQRKSIWSKKEASEYVREKSTLELIQELSSTPQKIKDTHIFKGRINKVSNREKSRVLIANSVDEVIEKLKKNPTAKNKELVKVIAAAVTSDRYVAVGIIVL